MPIDIKPGGTVYTGNAIKIFQLKAVIHAIKMEARGLRFRQRVKAGWAKRLGLSPRAKHCEVIQRIQAEINELEKQGV